MARFLRRRARLGTEAPAAHRRSKGKGAAVKKMWLACLVVTVSAPVSPKLHPPPGPIPT